MRILVGMLALSMALTGCLKTRNEVRDGEQRQVMQQQVTTMQRNNADATSRVSDMEELMRELNGRVEVVENKLERNNAGVEGAMKASQTQSADLNQKVQLLQEALTKMEGQLFQVTAEVQALKAERAAAATQAQAQASEKKTKKDTYDSATEYFNKKDWKQAILNYQKYRDENPKGGHFADATYKIGVAFQELGMKDESKTFYDEVVSKFPKSDEARRAKIRLKGLKK
ncbi:tetratricopeptide repeat protein [Bdellovibrio sp. HCB2-146]|uniref:tetratricopeptide repeat protein n=1 Tax=Bdellovibrio sp. HCB2-146 TaxID=3394362 RepID=UPI0039BC538C